MFVLDWRWIATMGGGIGAWWRPWTEMQLKLAVSRDRRSSSGLLSRRELLESASDSAISSLGC